MICRRARTAELGCKSGGVPRGDLEGRGTQIGSIGVDFYWGRGPNAKELGVSVNPYLPLTDSAFQSHTVIIFRLVSVSQCCCLLMPGSPAMEIVSFIFASFRFSPLNISQVSTVAQKNFRVEEVSACLHWLNIVRLRVASANSWHSSNIWQTYYIARVFVFDQHCDI